MLPPGKAGLGVPVLVTTRSTGALTGVLVVNELLPASGSLVVDVTLTVLETAGAGKVEATWTTMVKVGAAPAAKPARVKVTVPVPPTAGAVVVQPAGAVAETKVVPAGMPPVRLTAWASQGPMSVSGIE